MIVNEVVGKLSGGQKCQQVTIKSSKGNRIRTNVHAACVTETAVSPFFATPHQRQRVSLRVKRSLTHMYFGCEEVM